MSEFKQIIGRGTRLRDDYGKLWFNILDYTGSATRMFADPDFDGDPARITEEEVNDAGEPTSTTETIPEGQEPEPAPPEEGEPGVIEPPTGEPRKFYFDGGQVEVVAHLVHELDPNGKQLRVVKYTDYAAESVRSLAPTSVELRKRWADADQRREIIAVLAERGIDFDVLAEQTDQADADPFDLLCHLTFNAPLRTRRERAQRLKSERKDYFAKFSPEARQVLDELLEKYAEHGDAQFVLPDVLKVPPISTHGQPAEIIKLFGGPDELRRAVNDLQGLLYGTN
jgi:type I restriction enzyme, R subunit